MSRSTRDYANSPRKTRRRRKPVVQKRSHKGLWLITFLCISLFASGLFYLTHHEYKRTLKPQVASLSSKKAKAPPQAKPQKPRFEFYNMLPNMTVPVNEEAKQRENNQSEYVLQIASVKNYQDADRLKAQLTLLGFDVHINQIKHNNGIWNRVSLGPYASLKNVEKEQRRLQKYKIKGIVHRIH